MGTSLGDTDCYAYGYESRLADCDMTLCSDDYDYVSLL